MDDASLRDTCTGIAALVHQTGPSRRVVSWLRHDKMDVSVRPNGLISIYECETEEPGTDVMARLRQFHGNYEIEVQSDHKVWVNGRAVTSQQLCHGDMIEFGETGPLSRFRVYPTDASTRKSVGEIISDSIAYLRTSRQPLGRRIARCIRSTSRQLSLESYPLFRITVVTAFVALSILAYKQYEHNQVLVQELAKETVRLDSFSRTLAQARDDVLTLKSLKGLQEEFGSRLATTSERLATLERQSVAIARVVREARHSVFFIQGSYGFRHMASGKVLRQVLDDDGKPVLTPFGQPRLTLDGDGPVAEKQFTGTGFAAVKAGIIVTNRHVALPWENDNSLELLAAQKMEPVMVKFIAYRPNQDSPVSISLVGASEMSDLAVLRHEPLDGPVEILPLTDAMPEAGSEVILMGYPAGLRAMVAQSGQAFMADLKKQEDLEFWNIARRLAKQSAIEPLASRGIVGKVTHASVVYDAETTHGGSGGPVLSPDGKVIAVNSAIIPEFGGSNIGVPALAISTLIEKLDLR